MAIFKLFKNFGKLKTKHQTVFAIVIAFAVISFWRGIWGLLDTYLLPNHYQISLWISIFIGLIILIITNYTSKELIGEK